ncbi:MAG: EF-hand domain-containing protein [Duganella sp.]
MITLNSIGGGNLSSAIVSEKALEPKSIAPAIESSDVDLSAAVAPYLSLPGFNAPAPVDTSNSTSTDSGRDQSAALQALSESDEGLQQALEEFDAGLNRLVQRPETQVFQSKFGSESQVNNNLPTPDPLPGVDENGQVRFPQGDYKAADSNHDGKVSEDELRRFQEPLTYRSTESMERTEALADGPSVFSLTEANRAYGVVSAAAAAA